MARNLHHVVDHPIQPHHWLTMLQTQFPAHRTPAIPPNVSRRLRHVVRASLRSVENSHLNRRHAQELVWQWVGAKWPRLLPSAAQMQQQHFEYAIPGQELAVRGSSDGSVWTLAVAFNERRSERAWTTRAVVADKAGSDVLALQTSCTELADAPMVVAPPRLLGAWVQNLGLEDGPVAVQGEPRYVDSEVQLAAFCEHVLSAARTLPVIALANRPNSRFYGVDPRGLAQAVRGLAHVACLTPELALAATRRLGRQFAIVPGAARIYAPGFSSHSTMSDHPLVRNTRPTDESASDAGAFRRLLCQRICMLSVHHPTPFDALLQSS